MFNLNEISKCANSLSQFLSLKEQEPENGLSSSSVTFSTIFGTIPWGTEDLSLPVLARGIEGAPRTWYFIPKGEKKDFERLLQENFKRELKKNQDVFSEGFASISPLKVLRNKVTPNKNKGEFLSIGASEEIDQNIQGVSVPWGIHHDFPWGLPLLFLERVFSV